MFEEDLPKKKDAPEPRNLERLSIDELREYIDWLTTEIKRAEDDITRKRAASSAASLFFKP
ncbi:MAG: DUF1192 domain-containing protein [Rickettsiales bacterium]